MAKPLWVGIALLVLTSSLRADKPTLAPFAERDDQPNAETFRRHFSTEEPSCPRAGRFADQGDAQQLPCCASFDVVRKLFVASCTPTPFSLMSGVISVTCRMQLARLLGLVPSCRDQAMNRRCDVVSGAVGAATRSLLRPIGLSEEAAEIPPAMKAKIRLIIELFFEHYLDLYKLPAPIEDDAVSVPNPARCGRAAAIAGSASAVLPTVEMNLARLTAARLLQVRAEASFTIGDQAHGLLLCRELRALCPGSRFAAWADERILAATKAND